MEKVLEIITLVVNNIPAILAALGATVAAASAWVALTPTPRDDEFVGTIRTWVERFSAFLPSEGVKTRKTVEEFQDELRDELEE